MSLPPLWSDSRLVLLRMIRLTAHFLQHARLARLARLGSRLSEIQGRRGSYRHWNRWRRLWQRPLLQRGSKHLPSFLRGIFLRAGHLQAAEQQMHFCTFARLHCLGSRWLPVNGLLPSLSLTRYHCHGVTTTTSPSNLAFDHVLSDLWKVETLHRNEPQQQFQSHPGRWYILHTSL